VRPSYFTFLQTRAEKIRALTLCLGLLSGGFGARAQEELGSPLPPESPTDRTATERTHRHLAFGVALDNRNSFVQASAVRIIGLTVSLTPADRHYRLGLAGYTLRRDYSQLYTYAGKGKTRKLKDTLTPALSLTYFAPSFTYTFFRRRFIELSIPVDVGLGRSHYTITDENNNTLTDRQGLFFPAEVGLGVLLKPTRWIGLSGGAGYRLSLKQIDYKEDFDGWYYSYRVNLFAGAIWHDLRARRARRLHAQQSASSSGK